VIAEGDLIAGVGRLQSNRSVVIEGFVQDRTRDGESEGCPIHCRSDRVAHVGGTKGGQYQVGSGVRAPDGQRLAKIGDLPRDTEFGGDVEQAEEPDGRIDGLA
jgi:hypothetical protein